MKVFEENKSICGGIAEQVKQSISAERVGMAISILRDRIYSDKFKATLFETLSNALDEHVKYGIKRPVSIHLTKNELSIRDFARGLSKEDTFQVFFQYFESTKNQENTSIGGFGIGSKAPAAYTGLYLVISRFEGTKYTFSSSIDGNDSIASLIHSEPCDLNDTGIEVKIPLNNSDDYYKFLDLIKDAYITFGFNSDEPVIELRSYPEKIDIEDVPEDKWENYVPYEKTPRFAKYRDKEFFDKSRVLYIKDTVLLIPNNWSSNTFYSSFFKSCNYYAYDGDNIYKIDIPNEIFNEYNIIKNACTVLLFFKRGEIPISPTRESIEINNFTNDWIKGKFKIINKNYEKTINDYVDKLIDSDLLCSDIINKANSKSTLFYRNSSIIKWPDCYLNTVCSVAKNYYVGSGNITNINLKTKSLYSNPTIKKFDGEIIFIVQDKDPIKLPYGEIINALYNYLVHLRGNDYRAEVFDLRRTHIFCFVKDEEEKANFLNLRTAFTFNDKPCFRQNIDWFNYSDIVKHSTYVRPKRIKSSDGEAVVLRDYYTGEIIDEKEYKNTLVFYPSMLMNNDNYLNSYLAFCTNFVNYNSPTQLYQSRLCTDFGIKRIAKLYKNHYDKFVSLGCIPAMEIKWKETYIEYCKKHKLVYLPGQIINICRIYDIDFKSVTGYTAPRISESTPDYPLISRRYEININKGGFNRFIMDMFDLSILTNQCYNIQREFDAEIKKLSDKEILNFFYTMSSVCLDNISTNIMTSSVKEKIQAVLNGAGFQTKDKVKLTFKRILKKLNYKLY